MDYRKKRKIIILLSLVSFLFIFLFLEIKNNLNQAEKIDKLIINGKTINVEIAKTSKEHYIGFAMIVGFSLFFLV